MRTIILLFTLALVAVCSGQSDGRYRPFGSAQASLFGRPNTGALSPGAYRPDPGRYNPKANNDGRYTGNDGRYTGGNDGRYNGGDDGRYRPDDSGKYSGKYVHDARDADKYKHVDVPYKPGKDDISKYVGDSDKYVGGGQYKDKNTGSGSGGGKQKGSGSGSGSNSGSGANAGLNRGGAGSQKPGTGLKPPGFGGNNGVNSGSNSGSGGKPYTGIGGNVNSGFGNNAGSKLGSGSGKFGAGTNSGSGKGNGIGAPNGFGIPKQLKKGNSAGFYDNRNYGIIRKIEKVETDGYHYLYETENGITGEEQGKLHNRGTDEEAMKANGFYTYTGPDDVVYTVNYTADERGFLPQADHIPTPPPVPELIARMLEWQRQQGLIE